MNWIPIDEAKIREIVKPKPLLADAKVGDLVKLLTGGYMQISDIDVDGRIIVNKAYFNNNGWRLFHGFKQGIIEHQPLAKEGSAEWAWQMMLLGKDIIHCEYTHGNAKWRMTNGTARCCLAGMSADTKEKWLQNAISNGWQIYTEPEPEFKVGDWVEIQCQYRKHIFSAQIDTVSNDITIGIDGEQCVFNFEGYCKERGYVITRILSPFEVVVDFGSGIKGRIARNGVLGGCIDVFGESSVFPIARIEIAVLDAETKELVKSLLKAQEEK